MNKQERIEDPVDWLSIALKSWQSKVWTSLPGIIQSFDPEAMTCDVQPAVRPLMRTPAGDFINIDLPLLVDCPTQFPAGGGCTLTFPVVKGDECMLLISSRCLDSWWQSGEVQALATLRMNNIADAVALLGFRSKPRSIPSVSTEAAQLRSDDGLAFVEINPTTHAINASTSGPLNLTAPLVTINGNMKVNGRIDATDDVVAGTVSLQNHLTGGVTPGDGNSGKPVP
ncbi:Gp138 family membrane-puncturing spike protein [Pseudomonas sp. NPDC098747]|uniref:Gp138 family membrane-puncturing spike protein n=1 Tax=Pseudomonas sp. NPDC098747 TaxID=3364487 RepID=UPI00383B7635